MLARLCVVIVGAAWADSSVAADGGWGAGGWGRFGFRVEGWGV